MRPLGWLGVCLSVTACASARDTLMAAERRWEQAQVVAYTMEQTRQCRCRFTGQAYRVRVVGDSVRSAEPLAAARDTARPEHFLTVGQLFASARLAIGKSPDVLRVRYHPELGHVEELFVDPDATRRGDEYGYTISHLTAERR